MRRPAGIPRLRSARSARPALKRARKALVRPLITNAGEYTLEDPLHRDVVKTLTLGFPPGCGVVWGHVPLGGLRHKAVAGMLKGLGAKAGVWDLYFFWANGWSEALQAPHSMTGWIELKSATGTLNKAQRDFRDEVRPLGHRLAICRSVAQVLGALEAWGLRGRARIAA